MLVKNLIKIKLIFALNISLKVLEMRVHTSSFFHIVILCDWWVLVLRLSLV